MINLADMFHGRHINILIHSLDISKYYNLKHLTQQSFNTDSTMSVCLY